MHQQSFTIWGDEDLNSDALYTIETSLGQSENVLYMSGFDFETKIIALTDKSVIVANDRKQTELSKDYTNLASVSNEGRSLIIETATGRVHRYKMGEEAVVKRLLNTIRERMPQQVTSDLGDDIDNAAIESSEETKIRIAERVQFWEEQDRINQVLIPRVIRQHDLLTNHIADHENLPLVAGNAVSEALAQAREEQQQLFDAVLQAIKAQSQAQRQNFQSNMPALREEAERSNRIILSVASIAVGVGLASIVIAIIL